MDRRGFLKAIGGAVGGLALAEAIPFGRVWSFPSTIKIPATQFRFEKGDNILYFNSPVQLEAWKGLGFEVMSADFKTSRGTYRCIDVDPKRNTITLDA